MAETPQTREMAQEGDSVVKAEVVLAVLVAVVGVWPQRQCVLSS